MVSLLRCFDKVMGHPLIQLTRGDEMRNENGVTIFRVLISAASISFLLFSAAVVAAQTNQHSVMKTTAVGAAAGNESKAIPPIDRAAPADYRTATFGLG